MDVLLRHTILGECIRYISPSQLPYAEEKDPSILKNLSNLQDAQSDSIRVDENTSLLSRAEQTYGSEAVLVEWYTDDDDEVCITAYYWNIVPY